MKMKKYLGNICKIHINRNEQDLFYTAKVIDINDTHITFIDRYNSVFSYRFDDVIEISMV